MAGQDPTVSWFAPVAEGYPLFHYYQHLPHLIPAALYVLLPGAVPLADAFNWTAYLLLSLFPLSIFWPMRRFGFAPATAALASLVSALTAPNSLFGFDYGSFVGPVWALSPQVWGIRLLR